jgi:hypothetical protein
MSLHPYNLSKLFPPSPASAALPLPFTIDEMDFSNWLQTLSANPDEKVKCQSIFEVLRTLNNAFPPERKLIPGRTRLFFLEKMGSVLTASSALLTTFANSNSAQFDQHIVDNNETARSELSVWSNLELGNAYSLLSQEEWFKDQDYYTYEEKTAILTNGLNANGKALLYIYQTYTKPYVYFWHKCFQFYRQAKTARLLEPGFNPGAAAIENAFKRILVISLCNTNQFTPQEMYTIYELLGHYAAYTNLLTAVPQKKFSGIPSINLRGNGPPIVSEDHDNEEAPDRLYIATVNVASKILEATYDKRAQHQPVDRLMLLRLAKTLTLNERRKNQREAANNNLLGIVGFDPIIEFLRAKGNENLQISPAQSYFDPNRPGELRDLNFEISAGKSEPLENDMESQTIPAFNKGVSQTFPVIEFTDPAEIWSARKEDLREINMRQFDKSTKGYGLLWTDNKVRPKVGSIIGVVHKTLTIGLIRWMVQSKETGLFIGVELLGENAVTVKVSNPGYPDKQVSGLYLPGSGDAKQPPALIIANKDFRLNEFIFLIKNNKSIRYRQTKQLHITSFINHVEITHSY